MLLNFKRTVHNNCIYKIYTLMVYVLLLFIAGVFILTKKSIITYLKPLLSHVFNVMVGCGLKMNSQLARA